MLASARFANHAAHLGSIPCPGRGIIIGLTPSQCHYVQVYWIMGRSENSRNRIFKQEGTSVVNEAYDPAKMTDPSLIIYRPIMEEGPYHIVTNGDQTDTIVKGLKTGVSFETSLLAREYEPDPPHYTPRISGVIDMNHRNYTLSILKTANQQPGLCIRNFYKYDRFTPGTGHCIHTYAREEDGVLLTYAGEPYELPLPETIEESLSYYWSLLDEHNRVSLLVKHIDARTGAAKLGIINKHETGVEK
ncbi:IMP cyclohydrolase [Paenibacillus spongiae]|uniref:IMP cyclohydrolase n=1 Tax=Paenibacillus spongiae TaxID=2909671 RepID=A0ABY5S2U5_9BACL|nr:IMP cyclohydrolase [Paenibacillus spongiae]UVI27994.1 IMP cyclohydrolase [Paenibacillus spongiae]